MLFNKAGGLLVTIKKYPHVRGMPAAWEQLAFRRWMQLDSEVVHVVHIISRHSLNFYFATRPCTQGNAVCAGARLRTEHAGTSYISYRHNYCLNRKLAQLIVLRGREREPGTHCMRMRKKTTQNSVFPANVRTLPC